MDSPPPDQTVTSRDGRTSVSDSTVISGLYINFVLGVLLLLGFCITQTWSRELYRFRTISESVTLRPPNISMRGRVKKYFRWMRVTWHVTDMDILVSCGLDALVLYKLPMLGIQFFVPMAFLSVVVLVPLSLTNNWLKDNRDDFNSGSLAWLTLSAIEPDSKLLWVHFSFLYLYVGYGVALLYHHFVQFARLRLLYIRRGDDLGFYAETLSQKLRQERAKVAQLQAAISSQAKAGTPKQLQQQQQALAAAKANVDRLEKRSEFLGQVMEGVRERISNLADLRQDVHGPPLSALPCFVGGSTGVITKQRQDPPAYYGPRMLWQDYTLSKYKKAALQAHKASAKQSAGVDPTAEGRGTARQAGTSKMLSGFQLWHKQPKPGAAEDTGAGMVAAAGNDCVVAPSDVLLLHASTGPHTAPAANQTMQRAGPVAEATQPDIETGVPAAITSSSPQRELKVLAKVGMDETIRDWGGTVTGAGRLMSDAVQALQDTAPVMFLERPSARYAASILVPVEQGAPQSIKVTSALAPTATPPTTPRQLPRRRKPAAGAKQAPQEADMDGDQEHSWGDLPWGDINLTGQEHLQAVQIQRYAVLVTDVPIPPFPSSAGVGPEVEEQAQQLNDIPAWQDSTGWFSGHAAQYVRVNRLLRWLYEKVAMVLFPSFGSMLELMQAGGTAAAVPGAGAGASTLEDSADSQYLAVELGVNAEDSELYGSQLGRTDDEIEMLPTPASPNKAPEAAPQAATATNTTSGRGVAATVRQVQLAAADVEAGMPQRAVQEVLGTGMGAASSGQRIDGAGSLHVQLPDATAAEPAAAGGHEAASTLRQAASLRKAPTLRKAPSLRHDAASSRRSSAASYGSQQQQQGASDVLQVGASRLVKFKKLAGRQLLASRLTPATTSQAQAAAGHTTTTRTSLVTPLSGIQEAGSSVSTPDKHSSLQPDKSSGASSLQSTPTAVAVHQPIADTPTRHRAVSRLQGGAASTTPATPAGGSAADTRALQLWAVTRAAVLSGRVAELRRLPSYDPVSALFSELFPHEFDRALPIMDYTKLHIMLRFWNFHMIGLDSALEVLAQQHRRPWHFPCPAGCLRLHAVDTIDYLTELVGRCQRDIIEERQRVLSGKGPGTGCYVVLFKTQAAAALAASNKTALSRNTGRFMLHASPSPSNINWHTLLVPWNTRRWMTLAMVLPKIIMVLFPVAAFSAMFMQLDYIFCPAEGSTSSAEAKEQWTWPWYCEQKTWFSQIFKKVIVGWAPSLLLSLYSSMIIPNAFHGLVQASFTHLSLSAVDREISLLYMLYNALNVFLCGVLGASFMQQLNRALFNQGLHAFFTLLGTSLPQSSNFFLNYLSHKALVGFSSKLMFPHGGVGMFLFKRYLRLFRVFSVREQMFKLYTCRSPRYGPEIGNLMLAFVLGSAFAIISPLVPVMSVVFFLIGFFAWKYLLLYVFVRKYETGGNFFHFIFECLLGCLAIMVVMTGAVIAAKGGVTQFWLIMISLPWLILYAGWYARHAFGPMLGEKLPLEVAAQAPRAHVDPRLFIHPALHPHALGWHPDMHLVWGGLCIWGAL